LFWFLLLFANLVLICYIKLPKELKNALKRGQKLNVEVNDADIGIDLVAEDGESEEEIVITDSLCEPTKMLYMLELMLAFFHAWYKTGHPFCLKTITDKRNMWDAIRTMMKEILENAPRNDKNGWKLQKCHDMLHIVRDIENYGSPSNVNAAPNEITLLTLQRDLVREQTKREVFVSQVSKRVRESDLI